MNFIQNISRIFKKFDTNVLLYPINLGIRNLWGDQSDQEKCLEFLRTLFFNRKIYEMWDYIVKTTAQLNKTLTTGRFYMKM